MRAVFSLLRQSLLAAGVLVSFLSASSKAMFLPPEPTPVERLLKKSEDYLARHPDSAQAHYTLGRIHYLAFHLMSDQVPAFRSDPNDQTKIPGIAPQWMLNWPQSSGYSKVLSNTQAVDHATKALHHFAAVLQKDMNRDDYYPKLEALTYLGIACLKEEFYIWNATAKETKLPPDLTDLTLAKIRANYAKALAVALPHDSKITELPIQGLEGIVAYEAATDLIRLGERDSASLTAPEREAVASAKTAVAQFKKLPADAITPIVFSFQHAAHLDELLAPENVVDFDLRGYGPRERWPWVKPELGLLVWDPERTGCIRSGRQLFGSYTFQIFRATGYDALAALDDNNDGVLSGGELDGLSVWFDRNGDGISTPDEVTPLDQLGVTAIAVKADGHDGPHPTHARGITFRDGRTLRTWDWIVEPVQESNQTRNLASTSR